MSTAFYVVTGLLIVALGVISILITRLNRTLKKLDAEKLSTKKVLSQKKSSEVRLGKIGENMAPFIEDWPYDHSKFRFIGNPIDGIQFTDYEIIFIEIKTGKSKLTPTQKHIKKLIADGKVSFATFRIGERGCVLKKEEIDHCSICSDGDKGEGC